MKPSAATASLSSYPSCLFAPANARLRHAIVWFLCALAAVGYIIQCFTPLRMTEDGVIYLSIAHSVAAGKGFLYEGAPASWFPPGYPALLALLTMTGLGDSLYMNLFNLLAVGAGFLALRSIAGSRNLGRGRLCIVLLALVYSYIVIKDTALPLSDLVFFGLTLTAIALAESAVRLTGWYAWSRWASSLLLAAMSISIRWAGIGALAALLFEYWRVAVRGSRPARIVAAVFLGLAALTVAAVYLKSSFTPAALIGKLVQVYRERAPGATFADHLPDLGQLVLNTPQSKLPSGIRRVMYPAGFLLLLAVGVAIARSRERWSPGRTFVLCYSLMIFASPYPPGTGSEPRYWMPILPLFLMEIISWPNARSVLANRKIRFAIQAYVVYFIAAGIGALGYSDLISVSRPRFLNSNFAAQWRPQYEAWMRHLPATAEPDTDPRVLPILREYGGNW